MKTMPIGKALVFSFALCGFSAPALATFHLVKVVEVFPGTAASPTAQYVVLQAYGSGQNHVAGRSLTFFNSAGTLLGVATFRADIANGNNQTKLLVATTSAEAFFNIKADLSISPCSAVVYFECVPWVFQGGKVCWAGMVDCIAWGPYRGPAANVGAAFNTITGIRKGRAALRRRDMSGAATTLDAGDDTDNSAHDFVLGLPAPRNSTGRAGSIPAAACGNRLFEGLEECDDGNRSNGDRCSSTCRVETKVSLTGDHDDDGTSDLFWRHAGTGSNSLWRSARASMTLPATRVDPRWKVVGRGDFNGDRIADLFWRNAASGQNLIWRSARSDLPQAVASVPDVRWKVTGVGDFSGDGRADILWRHTASGANAIWKSGNAATARSLMAVSNQDWQVVGIGDFDDDGRSDLFWRNNRSGANSIWDDANAAGRPAVPAVTDLAWKVVGIGDFNVDGKADVMWRNVRSGGNAIWKSARRSTQQPVVAVTNQAWQVASIGDFNADGRSDVFWRNHATGANVIWKAANASAQMKVSGVPDPAWMVVPTGED